MNLLLFKIPKLSKTKDNIDEPDIVLQLCYTPVQMTAELHKRKREEMQREKHNIPKKSVGRFL